MRLKRNKALLIIGTLLIVSCGNYESFRNDATKDYSSDKMKKYAKYMIQGKTLYTSYCENCHQPEGNGLGRVFPPLAKADFMLNDLDRTICIIKNGLDGKIIVNGQSYNQKMPSNSELTDLEIAEIATYINNAWGNEKGMVEIATVNHALKNCK